jgi:murein DD-endopeptidase MepM/ murein hydrolase activator NlpD
VKKVLSLFNQLPKFHRSIIIGGLLFLFFIITITGTNDDTANTSTKSLLEQQLEIGKRYQIAMPGHNDITASNEKKIELPALRKRTKNLPTIEENSTLNTVNSQQASDVTWQSVTVKSGDSLGKIFKRLGFSSQTTYAISTAQGKHTSLLKRLNIGDNIRIASNSDDKLTALEFIMSKTETLFVNLVGEKYVSHKETKEIEVSQGFAHGIITSNFWNAGKNAGLTDGQVIELADIFGWDIDFALDIRADDSFHVIYEKRYIEGEYIGTGNILVAEFINQNDVFQAIRFEDGEYYDAKGKSMHKAFLRAPVNFKYISSNFKPKRFHPVQKRWKAHRGVDYAAKSGTPVVAAGNGTVTHSTYNKYNGNYVFIQHGNGIVTKYLHFTKRKVKKGQRVKQGQLIGTVGATGLAAGPHLHYEFLVNGVHRNPRTVRLPEAKPIAKKYRKKFDVFAKKQLDTLASSKDAVF